jgi:hypothetical protein
VQASTNDPASARTRPGAAGRTWGVPLLAALTTIVAALAVYFWVWPLLVRQRETAPPARKNTEAQERLAAGSAAFHEGSYALALEKLIDAHRLCQADPAALTDAERQQLNRLYAECELYANLVGRGATERVLADLLDEAGVHPNPEDWAAHFRRKYRGKTVIFDGVVRLDRRGRALDRSEVRGSHVRAHIIVEDLLLFHYLPTEPRRWIFGARLASVRDEGDAGWVIRLEPNSGVLLIDRQALVTWNPSLANDAELDDVLQRQRDKLPGLPATEPPP